MARYGTADAANRYDGIGVGRVMAYMFETQEGIPVDGTNALLRQLSPFTLRFVPPDEIIGESAKDAWLGTDIVTEDLIGAAARGSDTSRISDAVGKVFPIGTPTSQLQSVLTGALNTNLTSADFYPALADLYAAADITLQLQAQVAAEPLTLLVNPNQFSINYSKMQAFGVKTRGSSLFEAWGEDQPSISFSGSTAGFVAGVVSSQNTLASLGQKTGETASVSGYQASARRDSAAWQNFMSLYLFYRNNGYIFDTMGNTDANHFIGAIAIDYDQWTYVGHFESLKFSFEENLPGRVEFDCEFKVDRMYDWAESSYAVLPQTAVSSNQDISTTPFELL